MIPGLKGDIQVRFDQGVAPGKFLPATDSFGSVLLVHCKECLEELVAEANRFVVLRTVPPCLMNRKSGDLVDIYPKEEEPWPRRH